MMFSAMDLEILQTMPLKTFIPGRFEDLQSSNLIDGIYYIDPPRGYRDTEYGAIVGDFDQFVCKDLWDLL
jgi:hypothetical protein